MTDHALGPPGIKEVLGAGLCLLLILPTLYDPSDETGIKLRVILIDLSLPFLILLGGILIIAWIVRLSRSLSSDREDLLRDRPWRWVAMPVVVLLILVGLWFRFGA